MSAPPQQNFPDGLSISSAELQDLPSIMRIDTEHTGTEKRDYWQACYERNSADQNTTFLVAHLDGARLWDVHWGHSGLGVRLPALRLDPSHVCVD